jgi:hypothetical protein
MLPARDPKDAKGSAVEKKNGEEKAHTCAIAWLRQLTCKILKHFASKFWGTLCILICDKGVDGVCEVEARESPPHSCCG